MNTKKSVLVVDDSEFVRSYHARILEQAQLRAVTAVDGSDGLEKLYAESFSLVLTDINMSNMDGYEFIRRVRADGKYASLPIVIVSTQCDGTDRIKGFEAGANLYIVKPVSPSTMVEHIRMFLSDN